MSYNSVGGITQKTQVHKSKDQEQNLPAGALAKVGKTTYDLNYTYGEEQPHAPIHIGDQTYSYDANGNQTGWTDDKTGQRRDIMWDEENRIRSIYDNGSQHHYIYDASGERVIKGKSTGQRIFVNGEWKAGSGGMGNYTVYVNPYLVLRSGGYSKHYYIEGQRIVSKLGGGWDNTKNVKAGGDKVDYNGKTQKIFDGIVKNLKFLGADGQILTAGKSGKIPPGQLNGTATGNVSEAFRYFYHPDHLGSTSYVTDASGEVYQHLEYFAFGETFVEEHSNTDKTPYLFNGKELDEETGLYYYGARYYDARTSVFQSVDPDAEKYPSMSPFAYASNNPIRFIDVDGKGPGDPPNSKVAQQLVKNIMEMAKNNSLYCNTQTGCYQTVWKRVEQAYKDVSGKAPREFKVPDANEQYDGEGDGKTYNRWVPGGKSDFKILAASDFGNANWKNLPEEYRAKGMPGAMANAGLAKMVDDVWSGDLKPGAVLQLWTSQGDYEGIRSGKGYDTGGNNWFNEALGMEDFGHSAIFLGYTRNWFTGEINGMKIADQRGIQKISKNNWKYPVVFGANILDK
jgi:RHS repeat-associated protein